MISLGFIENHCFDSVNVFSFLGLEVQDLMPVYGG